MGIYLIIRVGTLYACKSHRREITYFYERTGRIFREDIKVCKMYIMKNFCPEPKKINS